MMDLTPKLIWILLAVSLPLSAGTLLKQRKSSAENQPNIVLLVADDLGWGDLSSYGHPSIRTPELDRMASEGQRWTNFYVSSPICSPSRGSMLTGRVETRTGLYGVRNGVAIENDPYGFPDSETTVAGVLKQAGYSTALFGKWHLGDAPHAYPTRHGFDLWWGTPLSNDAYFVGGTTNDELRKMIAGGTPVAEVMGLYMRQSRAAFKDPKSELWSLPLFRSERISNATGVIYKDELLERPIDQVTYDGRLTDQVINFLGERHKNPFFAMVGFEKPHLPHIASKAFAGTSSAGPVGDVIAEMDYNVGRILNTLRSSGRDKNTLVIFVSDNGPWILYEDLVGSAGILRDGKNSSYEGGGRIPALFWWPGRIKPALISDIGSTYEFMPTFSALAKAQLPAVSLDGFNLLPTLIGQSPSPRTTMPYFFGGKLMAWRDGDWKLNIFEKNGRNAAPVRKLDKPTLYNLGRDPSEKFDQAGAQPEIVDRLLSAANAFEASIARAEPLFDRVLKDAKR